MSLRADFFAGLAQAQSQTLVLAAKDPRIFYTPYFQLWDNGTGGQFEGENGSAGLGYSYGSDEYGIVVPAGYTAVEFRGFKNGNGADCNAVITHLDGSKTYFAALRANGLGCGVDSSGEHGTYYLFTGLQAGETVSMVNYGFLIFADTIIFS